MSTEKPEDTTWLEVVIPRRLYDAFRERVREQMREKWGDDEWIIDYPEGEMADAVAGMIEAWLRASENEEYRRGYRKALDDAAEMRDAPIQP